MPARRRNRIRRLYKRAAEQRATYAGAKERLFALIQRREERLTATQHAEIAAQHATFAALPSEAQQAALDNLTAILRARYG